MQLIDEIRQLSGVISYTYPKGSYIFKQGDLIDFVYCLTSGTACRTFFSSEGEESIYRYLDEFDFLGSLAVITDNPSITYNIIAKTECKGYKIPHQIFKEYAEQNPIVLKSLLIRAVEELNHVTHNGLSMRQRKMGNRVCQLLLERAVQIDQQLIVPKSITYLELSKFLGIHSVTLSRILRVLSEQSVIKKTKKGIILLDIPQLTRFAEGEKFLYK